MASTTKDERIKRRRDVAAAKLLGHTVRQIADAVDVSPSTVQRDVERIREEWKEEATRDLTEWLAEELATLTLLQHRMLRKALQGDDFNQQAKAVDRLLNIMDHRAKLIGLYAPQRVELVTMDVIDAEISRLEGELQTSGVDIPADHPEATSAVNGN